MLHFEFEFPDGREIHSLALGDMRIRGKIKEINSNISPRYSIMVVPSISSMLFDITYLFTNPFVQAVEFFGIGSTFDILFKKEKLGTIVIKFRDDIVDQVTTQELVSALWSAVGEFENKYGEFLTEYDSMMADLVDCKVKFYATFEDYLAV